MDRITGLLSPVLVASGQLNPLGGLSDGLNVFNMDLSQTYPERLPENFQSHMKPATFCRALSREATLGETIVLDLSGSHNDLFNLTIPGWMNPDSLQINIFELKTLSKVPAHLLFTCDTVGMFDLYFGILTNDTVKRFWGLSFNICRATIACMDSSVTIPLSTMPTEAPSDVGFLLPSDAAVIPIDSFYTSNVTSTTLVPVGKPLIDIGFNDPPDSSVDLSQIVALYSFLDKPEPTAPPIVQTTIFTTGTTQIIATSHAHSFATAGKVEKPPGVTQDAWNWFLASRGSRSHHHAQKDTLLHTTAPASTAQQSNTHPESVPLELRDNQSPSQTVMPTTTSSSKPGLTRVVHRLKKEKGEAFNHSGQKKAKLHGLGAEDNESFEDDLESQSRETISVRAPPGALNVYLEAAPVNPAMVERLTAEITASMGISRLLPLIVNTFAVDNGGYISQGPIASFFEKVCFTDAECAVFERCAPTLNPFTKPNTLIGLITPKTCQPKAVPPGYGSIDLKHHAVSLEESLMLESFDDALIGSSIELEKPAAPKIQCRAVQREKVLGEMVRLVTGGLENDLFNITLPPTISEDRVLVNIKETQTMIKVPHQFLFNCDAIGTFKLKFKVYLTNLSGGLLKDGQQVCAAEIHCLPPSNAHENVVVPNAFKQSLQSIEDDPIDTSQFRQDLQVANQQAQDLSKIKTAESASEPGTTDSLPTSLSLAPQTAASPSLGDIPEDLKQLLIADFLRARLNSASSTTTTTTTTTPQTQISVECSHLSIDAKVRRPVTAALGNTLYRLNGNASSAVVMLPGSEENAQSLIVNCEAPGHETKYAVIFAQSEDRSQHALKSCPISIIECKNEVLDIRSSVGSARQLHLDITSLHQNPVFKVHDADGDPVTVAVQDTKTAKVKFSLSHSCADVEEPTSHREQYLVTAFDGEDHSTTFCAVNYICD